jgi:hypothetical protein
LPGTHPHTYLSHSRTEDYALRLDEVAYIEQLAENTVRLFANFIPAQEELDTPAAILNMCEYSPPHIPNAHQPATDGDFDFGRLITGFGLLEGFYSGRRLMATLDSQGIWVDAKFGKLVKLGYSLFL